MRRVSVETQLSTLTERKGTLVALVGFFTSVYMLMLSEVLLQVESLGTVFAGEQLFLEVLFVVTF
jgi:hypothetical protein